MLYGAEKQPQIDLNHLGSLPLSELQKIFKRLFPRKAIPKVKQLIIVEIAYHVQSRQSGGLDKATQDRLGVCKQQFQKKQLAHTKANKEVNSKPDIDSLKAMPVRQPRIANRLTGGTVLRRAFNGRIYEVMTKIEQGKPVFSFQNNNYRSLSKIAEEITGSHWSGPRFFGLTKLKSKTNKIATVT